MANHSGENEIPATDPRTVSYSEIAVRLLSDNLLLTALELHTELVEAGKELPKLKEFFSNPGNFEPHAIPPSIPRSGSQATLDSLDLARFSEDGERGIDERVAVLEFELRKARETISALRANLTVATESESTTPENGAFKPINTEPIKPHEQRALNFLINEYLLLNGYKLTSNTFSDENENQDFDDWDDVGLNISRPPELVQLYRESGKTNANSLVEEKYTQTENETDNHELLRLQNRLHELELKSTITTSTVVTSTEKPISITSASTPDRFEMVISTDDGGSGTSTDVEWTRVNIPKNVNIAGTTDAEMVSLDENSEAEAIDGDEEEKQDILEEFPSGSSDIIDNSAPTSESNPIAVLSMPLTHREERGDRSLPETYAQQLAVLLSPPIGDSHEEQLMDDSLVHVVGSTLNKIVPNVILNKRGEVVPLLVRTIRDHPDSNIRDRLLQLLFNLHKRPGATERAACVSGVAWLARQGQANLIEAEVLPHCWEQLGHRHAERRQLAAQTCGVLAPSLAPLVRQSLLVSMLRQLVLDDRDENVRASAVVSLAGVLALSADVTDCESLGLATFEDDAPTVASACDKLLAPILFQWGLQSATLHSGILTKLLSRLKVLVLEVDSSAKMVRLVNIFNLSMPFLAVWLGSSSPSDKEFDPLPDSRWDALGCELTRPESFSCENLTVLEARFDFYSSHQMWTSLNWVINTMIPELLDVIEAIEAGTPECTSLVSGFRLLCFMLGDSITEKFIRPAFIKRLDLLENRIAQGINNIPDKWPAMALVPVTVAGVCYDNPNEAASNVSRILVAWPLCGAPIDCVTRTVASLISDESNHREPLMAAIWEGVVHARPAVREAAASLCTAAAPKLAAATPLVPELIANRLMPALVTLASDHEMSVRTATVPAFASLIVSNNVRFVHDKCYVQLQTFLSDPTSRDDPDMLLVLVQALGQVLDRCDSRFRDEIALPRLAEVAGRAAAIESVSRRAALTAALMEALAAATEIATSRHAVLSGLRALEATLETNSPHRATVQATIRSLEARQEPANKEPREIRQRVSQMFQPRPPTLPNLQSIFRKK